LVQARVPVGWGFHLDEQHLVPAITAAANDNPSRKFTLLERCSLVFSCRQ